MTDDSTFRSARGVYGISVTSELAGVGPQTLRLYERRGLDDDLERLKRDHLTCQPGRESGRHRPHLGPGNQKQPADIGLHPAGTPQRQTQARSKTGARPQRRAKRTTAGFRSRPTSKKLLNLYADIHLSRSARQAVIGPASSVDAPLTARTDPSQREPIRCISCVAWTTSSTMSSRSGGR